MVDVFPVIALGPSNLLTVLEELCGVRFKWYNIGLQLGLSMGILETIRHDYRDQSMDCLREVLRTWLKSGCDTTWNRVIQGLMSPAVAEGRLSCALKTKYYPQLPTGESASGTCISQLKMDSYCSTSILGQLFNLLSSILAMKCQSVLEAYVSHSVTLTSPHTVQHMLAWRHVYAYTCHIISNSLCRN